MGKKYGRVSQDTDDNIIRCTGFACWINEATDTHSEYVILLFHSNTISPPYYIGAMDSTVKPHINR